MSPRELLVLVVVAACAVAGWRMGESKGINPWICGGAALFLGPLFLLFLLWVPARGGREPSVGPAPWNDPERAPLPPREVRHVTPPPPRDAG